MQDVAATKTITIDEIKQQVEEYARIAFRAETFPHGMTWDQGGKNVEVLALAVPIRDALHRIGVSGCFAAALMIEAFGAEREDIISITIDHPDGVVLGRIEVEGGEERLGSISWTTEVIAPTAGEFQRFPALTATGRIRGLTFAAPAHAANQGEQ